MIPVHKYTFKRIFPLASLSTGTFLGNNSTDHIYLNYKRYFTKTGQVFKDCFFR